ncbi:hypothetical protein ASPBRDRAFT_35369 [Aspergillus brasiliensis CBS 101740]|uniref:Major facilitator superfamily (MFS) profile domain-containing protein n=1 Tax=Aspergillus brasiliensis (strain CBS 101740 / IMI 381727 / IBT 21946) TaxID=767769 RepID=A0A1L9U383_ASPBC|nr:hypothetical protein ASPBRDRAFT_35369 [Aspergillus brasiliensis CBS 101740]
MVDKSSDDPGALVDFRALRVKKYAATTIAVFLVEFAVFIPITCISSYRIRVGLDRTLAYALSIFLNLVAVPGRFLPGLVADRLGRFNVFVVTSVVCAAFTLALWLTLRANMAAIVCYAVLFGFWSGAAISFSPVCISQVCQMEDLGKRSGTTFTVVSVGILTGIPIAGAIQQQNREEHGGPDCR